MSKSLGNFLTVRQLLEEGFRGEAIRLALLSGHYRQPLDITREKITEAKAQLDRLYRSLLGPTRRTVERFKKKENELLRVDEQVVAALEDDLNTPQAISRLHELATDLNKVAVLPPEKLMGLLKKSGELLGILQQDPDAWLKQIDVAVSKETALPITPVITQPHDTQHQQTSENVTIEVTPAELKITTHPPVVTISLTEDDIDRMIEERRTARQAKDFGEADRIRDELKKDGIILKDDAKGSTDWERG
jgi:cysteinyl-tRNA synthetase